LTAVRLSRMIRKDLGITVPLSVLFDPQMNLKRLTEFAQNPSSGGEDSIIDRLFQDAELELNGTLGKPTKMNSSPSMVFITGATGFVGAFLLFEMLHKYPTNCKFVCLVRCEPSINPLNRIRENLVFLRLWQNDFEERIIPLRGDLAQTRFGLDEKKYIAFATQTDIIFHCGATVNFVLPYSQLYASNVCGTREVIRFATHASNCIPVQYISTISVLPPNIVHEVDIDQISPNDLTNGYGQSKWVAEKLMAKAHRLGLPVAIYRLGSMCSDSNTGACNPLDINTIVVAATLKIGSYPIEAINTKLYTLPVDFAAESIVRLSLTRPDVYGNVYHVLHPDGGVPFHNVVDTSASYCGIKMEGIAFEQWRIRLTQEKIGDRSFESLGEFPLDSLFLTQSILSSKQFYSLISPLKIPAMDKNYVSKWLTFILKNILN
jgi:thioester reductase-like protein